MARPRIPEATVKAVQYVWGEDPNRSAAEVHRRVRRRSGLSTVSLRKVQHIVGELKRRSPKSAVADVEWAAWQSSDESPEDTAYIFTLQYVSRTLGGPKLNTRHAKWARLLRETLQDAIPQHVLFLVHEYSKRERIALNTGSQLFTTDLDDLMVFKPWLSLIRYAHYVSDETVPPPFMFSFAADEDGPMALWGIDALLWELVIAMTPAEAFRASSTTGIWHHETPDPDDVEGEFLRLKDVGMDETQRMGLLRVLFSDELHSEGQKETEDTHEGPNQTPG